jgi:D-lactate dehydrogenase
MLAGKYEKFYEELRKLIPKDRIYLDDVRTLSWGTDAGFYRLIPQMVVCSASEEEVAFTLKLCDKFKIPVTFRGAGTSLSGQAISDSILLVAGKNWERFSLSNNAETITVQCGLVGGRVNEILAPFGRKLGPDPASINSAMIGGIVMNNASGMNCGTHENSYKTIQSARIIFADGALLDTGDFSSRESFRKSHGLFIKKIEEIRDKVRANKTLAERIRKKYTIKNTTGLSINPFIDYDDPFHIIMNLLVGSEGTLAFASEFTMRTVVDLPFKASAMIYFADIVTASKAVLKMKPGPVDGAELLDRLALKSVENQDGIPTYIKDFPDGVTAILVETKTDSKIQLDKNIAQIIDLIKDIPTVKPIYFTDKPEEYSKYWKIRKGVFPSVGGMRPLGTTCFIEDLAFQIDDLPNATDDLQKLIKKHGYSEGVIYGHALEGNFHFIINLDFDNQNEVKRYETLMKEVVELVVKKYDGSLKAEHGTGRNMAPFVKYEWGEDAYNLMKKVKELFDPNGLLNPGVIFNDNPNCYLENFKSLTPTNKHVDKCIECGFCEVNCLTCGLTLSSRQRIVVQREISRLRKNGNDKLRIKQLQKGFKYFGEETCAGDGLCATSCPVSIDTGELTHDIRAGQNQTFLPAKLGAWTAHNFGKITPAISGSLKFVHFMHSVMGTTIFGGIARGARFLSGNKIPLWTPAMPKGINRPRPSKINHSNPLKVVYFPSCLNQTMGPAKKDPYQIPLHKVVEALLKKAGYEVIYPNNMKQLCCGTIWESKGFYKEAQEKSSELELALLKATENGKYPVICDQSPCLYTMKKSMKPPIKLYEPVEFIFDNLMDKLDFTILEETVAIHQTCSTIKMGLQEKFLKLALACAKTVVVPEEVGCCGFAGDKGFTHPEVNAFALRKLRPAIEKENVSQGFCNSRTCEIGLTTHSDIPYQSIVYLVDKCTKKKG